MFGDTFRQLEPMLKRQAWQHTAALVMAEMVAGWHRLPGPADMAELARHAADAADALEREAARRNARPTGPEGA